MLFRPLSCLFSSWLYIHLIQSFHQWSSQGSLCYPRHHWPLLHGCCSGGQEFKASWDKTQLGCLGHAKRLRTVEVGNLLISPKHIDWKITQGYSPTLLCLTRISLNNVFDEVIEVDLMDSRDNVHLSLLGRPELGVTFTKIHCWTLTQYRKCVFLDADTLVSELLGLVDLVCVPNCCPD